MHWERLSEDVYVFTSDRYAQVTASLIVSGTVGVVIDTLPFPQETSQIALFARRRCTDGVRYVIYTQHQADHTYGAFLFPRAEIISHTMCREILLERGFKALERAKSLNHELDPVRLRIPTLTFDSGTFSLRLPGKTLDLLPTPGHTPDAISVILQEEKLLFAGDTIMAIPTIGEGDVTQLRQSTELIATMPLESIVQGHGEIILRGEIKDNIRRSLNYLEHLNTKVRKVVDAGGTLEEARQITIESCGLQRVLLNGMVTQLHIANVTALYHRVVAERGPVKVNSPRSESATSAPAASSAAPAASGATTAATAPAAGAANKAARKSAVTGMTKRAVLKPAAKNGSAARKSSKPKAAARSGSSSKARGAAARKDTARKKPAPKTRPISTSRKSAAKKETASKKA
jgi:glyoxylase-like metal-dependent hydrolase (beta-lactamase superfamily II)